MSNDDDRRRDDERGVRPGSKYPTPASGVRVVTERTSRSEVEAAARRAQAEEADRVERMRGFREDQDTPVNMPIAAQVARASERQKATQTTANDIQVRVGVLESGLKDANHAIGLVSQQVVALDTGVELLVEEAKESRRERQERERAAEARATAELAFRRERALKVLTIVVPTLTALGAIIAGLAGAFR